MYSIKISQKRDERTSVFNKSIKNITEFVSGRLNQMIRVANDNKSIEITSGSLPALDDDQIVADLLIKKRVVINKSDFNDKRKLDKFIVEIKNFCNKADEIEDISYLPPHMRE